MLYEASQNSVSKESLITASMEKISLSTLLFGSSYSVCEIVVTLIRQLILVQFYKQQELRAEATIRKYRIVQIVRREERDCRGKKKGSAL